MSIALSNARAAMMVGLRQLGSEVFGARVWRDRTRPLDRTDRPGVLIYTPKGRAELESVESALVYQELADLIVHIEVVATDRAFDLADRAAEDVLQFVGLNPTLGGTVRRVAYLGHDSTLSGGQEKDVVVKVLRFELEHEVVLPRFRHAHDLEEVSLVMRVGPEGTPPETMVLQIPQEEV